MSEAPVTQERTGDEHDAWLHQALRHAPDAMAVPPLALRESILAQARSAVRPRRGVAASASFADRAAAFWSWLARPPVAAGFASVMAATLVGLMWWDRPMDEGLTPPPSRSVSSASKIASPSTAIVADAPPSLPAPSFSTAPEATAAAPANALAPQPLAAKRALAVPTPTTPAGVADEKKAKDRATSHDVGSAPPVAPSAFPLRDHPEENAAVTRTQEASPSLARKAERPPMAAPTESPRPAATEPLSPTLAAPAAAEIAPRADAAARDSQSLGAAGVLAKAAPAPIERQRAATSASNVADAIEARPAAAQAFVAAPTARLEAAETRERRFAESPARPMATLLAAVARGDARWTREVAGGDAAPIDAAVRGWLASVDGAAAGHWQASAHRETHLDDARGNNARTLLLDHDGVSAARVRIDDSGVLFESRAGAAWFAPMSADVVVRLRATLAAISR